MKRTSRIFLGLLLVLVLLVAGTLWYIGANLNSIVATIIEDQGSEATQTDVRVGSVELDIRGGSGRITGLSVANPAGFSDDAAISFGDLQMRMDPLAVTSDPIVIGEINVSGAELLLEQTVEGNNLRTLQDNLGRQPTEASDAADSTALIIERFTLGASRVEVRVPQLGESRSVTIPQIVVTDIGRASNGATASEVAKQILEPIIRKTLQSGAAAGVEDTVRDRIGETRDRVTEGLLDRLGQPEDQDAANDGEEDDGDNP